jgi:hypothetical protein
MTLLRALVLMPSRNSGGSCARFWWARVSPTRKPRASAQVAGHLLPVAAGGVAEGVADQVQHAGLHQRLGPDGGDRLRQPFQAVADHDLRFLVVDEQNGKLIRVIGLGVQLLHYPLAMNGRPRRRTAGGSGEAQYRTTRVRIVASSRDDCRPVAGDRRTYRLVRDLGGSRQASDVEGDAASASITRCSATRAVPSGVLGRRARPRCEC